VALALFMRSRLSTPASAAPRKKNVAEDPDWSTTPALE
jgi:hypothetical protein